MNPLLDLIPKLEDFLKSVKVSMINDLEFFIKRESLNPNLRMLSFIYSYEDFKTLVYSIDNKGKTITDVVGLPIKNYQNLYSIENLERFLPYELEEGECRIHDEYENFDSEGEMSNYWDYNEEYRDLKNNIFTKWFIDCWLTASANTKTKILTCFAMHDSSGGIDLNTAKYITDKEIENLFE